MNRKSLVILLASSFMLVIIILGIWALMGRIKTVNNDKSEISKLSTLPYLQGQYKPPKNSSITKWNPNLSLNSINLYNSNHCPCAIIMDMDGTELHKWQFIFKKAFPAFKEVDLWYKQKHWRDFWRRVHVFNNGDLLAIFEGHGIIKIDKKSNLLWSKEGNFHHDLEIVDNKIYVLNRRVVKLPRINNKQPILEDLISVLSNDGKEIESISILELFERSDFSELMDGMPPFGDIFHTNTLEVFDGKFANRSPIFKKGNVLLSMRMLDTIAIADLEARKIVWAKKPGIWKTQHQPTLLDTGNILLFNNLYIEDLENKTKTISIFKMNGYRLVEGDKPVYQDNKSSVIEFDPLTMKVIWEYKRNEKNKFFSKASGSVQRLPNGNTIITESDKGIAFEVTHDGQVVWQYVNKFRTGPQNQYISGIQEMLRLFPNSNFFLNLD